MIKNRYYPLSNGNTDFVKLKNNRTEPALKFDILHIRSGEKMGFISFNEKYYLQKLSEFEEKNLNGSELQEVKQLLKILDDLSDEGYTALNNCLENKFHCITRLRSILEKHGETPFPVISPRISQVIYGENEFEATAFCHELINAKCNNVSSSNDFLQEIIAYSKWIEYKNDTAYIFLLRDTLLPYIYFVSKGRKNLHPWIIGRTFLNDIAMAENIDDEIRLPIYEALENGITHFPAFKEFCKEHIRKTLTKYPDLERTLKGLLQEIHENKIEVIESGYCGTIPMLLSALDERVDFKFYTTAPFLYETYSDKIFCRKYENIRLFETLISQNTLFKYSSFRDGKFYIKRTDDAIINQKALEEICVISKAAL